MSSSALLPTAAAMALAALLYALQRRHALAPRVRPGVSEASMHLLQQGRNTLLSKLLDIGGFFGIDIGGSLTKLLFFLPDDDVVAKLVEHAPPEHAASWLSKLASVKLIADFLLSRTHYGATGVRDAQLSFHMPELGGSFHFIRFESRRMRGALRLAKQQGLNAGMHTICGTGGGAIRFKDDAARMLGVNLVSRDEIDCLVKGMGFLMLHVPAEAYTFHGSRPVDRPMHGVQYPYMLVNIGSGVGFILVRSETHWERVSGTSLGGGTYYGLCHMLTGIASFDEMLDLAELGNNANVDLTVGDIYGGDYASFGLKASTIASSFGKALTWASSRAQPAGAAHDSSTGTSSGISSGFSSSSGVSSGNGTFEGRVSGSGGSAVAGHRRSSSGGRSSSSSSQGHARLSGHFRRGDACAAVTEHPAEFTTMANGTESTTTKGDSSSSANSTSSSGGVFSNSGISRSDRPPRSVSDYSAHRPRFPLQRNSNTLGGSGISTSGDRSGSVGDTSPLDTLSSNATSAAAAATDEFYDDDDYDDDDGNSSASPSRHTSALATGTILPPHASCAAPSLALPSHASPTSMMKIPPLGALPTTPAVDRATLVPQLQLSSRRVAEDAGAFSTIGGLGPRRSDTSRLPSPEDIDTGTPTGAEAAAAAAVGSFKLRAFGGTSPLSGKYAAVGGAAAAPSLGRSTSSAATVAADAASSVSSATASEGSPLERSSNSGGGAREGAGAVSVGVSAANIFSSTSSTTSISSAAAAGAGATSSAVASAAAATAFPTDAASVIGLSAAATPVPGGGRYASRDIARSLLIMISNNIGQLAYLNAIKHKCKHVYFAGNFLRHDNTIAMRTLAYAITFWSNGQNGLEALFLRHEGYCGALGAFLSTLENEDTAEHAPSST